MDDDEWDRKVARLLITKFEGRAKTDSLERSLCQENLLRGGMDRVLKRLSDNSRFLIFKRGEQVKYVSVDWENVGICSEFRKPGCETCRRENCSNFHVCKFFITCKCKKGSTCHYGHNLQNTANTRVSDSLGMSSFSAEEIRTIIFRSHPLVCVNYNTGGCDDNDCPDLHVCSLFIIHSCKRKTDCRLEHSFRTSEHNQWVLDTFNVGHLTHEELRKKILVKNLYQPQSQLTRTVSSSSVLSCSTSTSEETEDCIVSVFNFLLKRFFGRTKFNTFLTERGNLLQGLKRAAIIKWLKYNSDRFLLYENEGDVKYISVYNRRARACFRYRDPSSSDCGDQHCKYFHVCRRYVGGDCVSPRCILSHNLSSSSNVKVRSDLNLDQLTDGEVLALMLCSSPAVCVNHNKSGCNLSDCPELHVCLTYIFNQCTRGDGCKFGHAIRDSGEHNSYVLKAFRMDTWREDVLRRLVIVNKGNNREDPEDVGVLAVQAAPSRGQEEVATVSSVHQAATVGSGAATPGVAEAQIEKTDYIPDLLNWSSVQADDKAETFEYICETYTRTGACPQASNCPHYHNPDRLPYLWLMSEDGHSPSVTVDIEKGFCGLCDIFVKQFPVDFSTMSVTVERMGTNHSIKLRRLSTPSYVTATPETPLNFYTQWVWYREEYDGTYVEFYPGSLQYTLEEKYLKGQHKYYLEFEELRLMVDTHSSPMIQTNLDTMSSTRIVRRPVFVSPELSDPPAMSPLLLTVVPDLLHQVPEHWTTVDHFQSFELVELDSADQECVDVRKQFFSTMDRKKHEVVHVFRVQNPALWDTYCSARRAMTPQGQLPEEVEERQLFHGTPTLQAARGICANSFDFRRSGENVGVLWGKGAYFSTTAGYSHSYTVGQMEASGHLMRYMFLGRVLVGQYTLGRPFYTKPPERKGLKMYDSCVNNVDKPTIFVIFDLTHSYPEYFIKYIDAPHSKQSKLNRASSSAGSSCPTKPLGSSSICTSTSTSAGSPYTSKSLVSTSTPSIAGSPSTSKSVGSPSSAASSGFPSTSTSTGFPTLARSISSPTSVGSPTIYSSVASTSTPKSSVSSSTLFSAGSPSTSKFVGSPSTFALSKSISTPSSAVPTPTSKSVGSPCTPTTAVSPSTSKSLRPPSTISTTASTSKSTGSPSTPLPARFIPSSKESVAPPSTSTSATTGLPSTYAGSTSTKSAGSSSISPFSGSSVPSVAGSLSTLRYVGSPSTSGSPFASTSTGYTSSSTDSPPGSSRLSPSAHKHTPSHSMQPVSQPGHMPSSAAQTQPVPHPACQPSTPALTPSGSPSTHSPPALSARRAQSLLPETLQPSSSSSFSSSSCSSSSSPSLSSSPPPNMSSSDYGHLSDSNNEFLDTLTIFAIIITVVAIIIFISPHRP